MHLYYKFYCTIYELYRKDEGALDGLVTVGSKVKGHQISSLLTPDDRSTATLTTDRAERQHLQRGYCIRWSFLCINWHAENKEDATGRSPDLHWMKDTIQIAVATGLRWGELLNLRWSDIDFNEGRIHVRNREDFRTKSGAERVVPVRGPALDVLRRRHAEKEKLDGPVITDRTGKPPKADRMTRRFKDIMRGAKLKGRDRLSFHSLRHPCGAWLASKGVSERLIQEILGHASSRTTQKYSHVASSAVEGAMEEVFGS